MDIQCPHTVSELPTVYPADYGSTLEITSKVILQALLPGEHHLEQYSLFIDGKAYGGEEGDSRKEVHVTSKDLIKSLQELKLLQPIVGILITYVIKVDDFTVAVLPVDDRRPK